VSNAIIDAIMKITKYDLNPSVRRMVNNMRTHGLDLTERAFKKWAETPAGKKYEEELAAAVAAQ